MHWDQGGGPALVGGPAAVMVVGFGAEGVGYGGGGWVWGVCNLCDHKYLHVVSMCSMYLNSAYL